LAEAKSIRWMFRWGAVLQSGQRQLRRRPWHHNQCWIQASSRQSSDAQSEVETPHVGRYRNVHIRLQYTVRRHLPNRRWLFCNSERYRSQHGRCVLTTDDGRLEQDFIKEKNIGAIQRNAPRSRPMRLRPMVVPETPSPQIPMASRTPIGKSIPNMS